MNKARIAVNAGYAENLRLTGKGVGIAILDTGLSPVSYTHLDVYKRQVYKA